MKSAKLFLSDFVNQNTINIFTDASMMPMMKPDQKHTIGCYGFLTMREQTEINSGLYIDTYSTVNRAEIKGIKNAVLEAINLRRKGFRGIINIFSDSQISVMGIREWIFTWYNNGRCLENKSGNEVANQSEFIEIMNLIVYYNPYVNFYHMKGHVDPKDIKTVCKAAGTFIRSNMDPNTPIQNIDLDFIKFISRCNNEIDNRTRWHLRNQIRPEGMIYQDPFTFIPTPIYDDLLHTYNIMTGGFYNV